MEEGMNGRNEVRTKERKKERQGRKEGRKGEGHHAHLE
jgi:hypothetical protein